MIVDGGDSSEVQPDWKPTASGAHLRGRATRNTAPEVLLRKALHAQGLRYRLGRRVGRFRPDIVFPGCRVAVFVDGCFWHGCPSHGAAAFRGPNAEQWRDKLAANQERDLRAIEELAKLDWRAIRIWECDVKHDLDQSLALVRQAIHDAAIATSS